jgi:hypothetical protein
MEGRPNSSPNRNPRNGHVISPPLVKPSCSDSGVWLTWMTTALVVLLTARSLHPEPNGFGTHTQLGLPPCLFRQWAALPCPTCGLTTCFCLLAHGYLRAGMECHPVGALLFTLVCLSIPLCVVALAAGLSPVRALTHLQARGVCVVLAVALLLQWFLNLSRILLAS